VVLAATGLKRLDVGVVVIQSRGTGELGWEEVAEEVEHLRVDREHLELVRAPLPEAVGVCLRGLLA
jgi:thioesterase domain-containing protein